MFLTKNSRGKDLLKPCSEHLDLELFGITFFPIFGIKSLFFQNWESHPFFLYLLVIPPFLPAQDAMCDLATSWLLQFFNSWRVPGLDPAGFSGFFWVWDGVRVWKINILNSKDGGWFR